jgi:hypothetical protein
MFKRICLVFACALCASSLGGAGDEKKKPESPAEVQVRLRLNAIESAALLERYEMLIKQELSLQDSLRACIKSGDDRVHQYGQALQDAQSDLEKAKKTLITLELDRARLLERLGKKNAADATPAAPHSVSDALDRILMRLSSIEKRLEKLERPK